MPENIAEAGESGVLGIVYRDYTVFKRWTEPFTYSAEDAETFAAELAAPDLRGKSILEVGFGNGNFLAWARDQGAEVVGSEINHVSLQAARATSVNLIEGDLVRASGSWARSFDYILAFDVFEHLALPTIVDHLEAFATMLRPGGRVLLRFPNAGSPFGLAYQHGDVTHVTALTGAKVEQLSARTGLEFVLERPAHRVLGPKHARRLVRRFRYLLQHVANRLVSFVYAMRIDLSPNVVVVLRKRKPAQ